MASARRREVERNLRDRQWWYVLNRWSPHSHAVDATAREYYQPLELRALLYSERNASRMNATTMFRKSSTPMT